jgi:hypothetical protein
MDDKVKSLIDEQLRLNERLKQLNVNSPGRERIVERLQMIDDELKTIRNKAILAKKDAV